MDNSNDSPEFLTNKEAAQLLRLSEVTLWRLRKNGAIPFIRIMSKILFRRSDLEGFLLRNLRNA
ncbi:MAG: helix-turn-helix domain-containing protein [Acidobacteria bacterium]|nr:helix-turn-helix domain-containing protein [Acidobacteriota bacterium]